MKPGPNNRLIVILILLAGISAVSV